TSDLVAVEVSSIANVFYTAPNHSSFLEMERRTETIAVKGEDPETVEYSWTIWGPVVGVNDQQRPLALRWVAHDPTATNFSLLDMESARTVEEGISVAHRAGVPAQNIVLADRAGAVAWTIAGRLPKRVGFDGRLPVTFSFGDRRWDGYLSSEETPVVRGPDAVVPGQIGRAHV